MIAVYARQSVDKKDSISIESQIEFCKYEARGEEFKTYTDKGFSGKNTRRPQFQKMMEDIKEGKVEKVIVYKLDRISRSILDFSEMMEEFNRYGVEFISSTEKFDTSTPMGRAMLNICIVFAQLERETIQKRVADAYRARLKMGLYMGGKIPYGYKLESLLIQGVHTKKYVTNPEECEAIKEIFRIYSNPTTSTGDVVKCLNESVMTRKTRGNSLEWRMTTVLNILRNPVYVEASIAVYNWFKRQGAEIINPPSDFDGTHGCYLYQNKDIPITCSSKSIYEGCILVVAPHEWLVPSETWLKCRRKLSNTKKQVNASHKSAHSWLSGKLKCAKCGFSITVHPMRTRTIVFCRRAYEYKDCLGIGRPTVTPMEQTVEKEILQKLRSFKKLSKPISEDTNKKKIDSLNMKDTQIGNEIESLLEKISQADDTLMIYINQRIGSLDAERKKIRDEINEIRDTTNEVNNLDILDHVDKWDKLSMDDKRAVLDILVEKIMVSETGIEIVWKA